MLNAYISGQTGILHDPSRSHHSWFAAGRGSASPSIRILKTVAASSLSQMRLQQMMEVSGLPQTTQLSSRPIQSCQTTLWESMMMLMMTCMNSGGTNTPEVSGFCNIVCIWFKAGFRLRLCSGTALILISLCCESCFDAEVWEHAYGLLLMCSWFHFVLFRPASF